MKTKTVESDMVYSPNKKHTLTTIFMLNHTFLSSFWEGFKIVKSTQTESLVSLTLKPNATAKCSCGLEAHAVHEYQWRHVKDAMILGVPVELCIQTRRVKCIKCGIKTESLSWLEPHARITNKDMCREADTYPKCWTSPSFLI